MKFTHFFIARPIFAIVLSLLMLLAGAIAFLKLPLSEYPAVTPPTVQVSASYPGANPQVIADTVAAPLEQVINGVDGMLYMNTQMVVMVAWLSLLPSNREPILIWRKFRCKTGYPARCLACPKKSSELAL